MPLDTAELLDQALDHHHAGRLAEAEALYRQILELDPAEPEAWHGLGVLAHQHGQPQLAIDLLRQAVRLDPDEPEFHNSLSVALHAAGRMDEAIAAARQAIALQHDHPLAHSNLATALLAIGQTQAAIAEYRLQLQLAPEQAEVHANFARALRLTGDLAGATAANRRAVELNPRLVEGWRALGLCLKEFGDLDGAVAAYQWAIALPSRQAESLCGIADTYATQGKLADAIACYRVALKHDPEYLPAHDGLLYLLHFSPDHGGQAILREHEPWARLMSRRFSRLPACQRRESDRIRVGYVSADFRNHVVGRNVEPILRHRDRAAFEIFCYSYNRGDDAMTDRLRGLADHFKSLKHLLPEQAADTIRVDGIDVLIDLSHHLSGNALAVFALRPAAVQATHLGCSATTGLPAIDYRITDPWLDPPDGSTASFGTEKLLRLPHTYWCYVPPEIADVAPLPAIRTGFITFGSLNSMHKVNPTAVALWAAVLRAVPDARFHLHAHQPPGGDRSQHAHVLGLFAQNGVNPDRITLIGRRPFPQFLDEYHAIDIALDPIPYTGHMTSLDAFWMGVPVITLAGQTPVSRAGMSIATNLRLPQLIAHTPDEYTSIAIQLAADRPALSDLRLSLRARMQQSPLCDATTYARAMDEAILRMHGE